MAHGIQTLTTATFDEIVGAKPKSAILQELSEFLPAAL